MYLKKMWKLNMGQQLSWLEHTTDNREVDGSSPFWPTTSTKGYNRSQDRDDREPKANAPKWTRKAALGNSPVDCCNRRGFSAEKRVLGPPLHNPDPKWGVSSAGRAPALQAGGQRFDPANLHHFFKELTEVPT